MLLFAEKRQQIAHDLAETILNRLRIWTTATYVNRNDAKKNECRRCENASFALWMIGEMCLGHESLSHEELTQTKLLVIFYYSTSASKLREIDDDI